MKKITISALLIGALLAQSCTMIDTSSVGLKVDKLGDEKGLVKVQNVSGFTFYNPFLTSIYEYPANIQHKSFSEKNDEGIPNSISVTSSDGGRFRLDVDVQTQIIREQAGNIFKKYRLPLDELMNTRFKSLVRKALVDEASKFKADSLLQYRSVYEGNVDKTLTGFLMKEGFVLNNITITDIQAPKSYSDAIENKIRIQQQTAQAEAQLAKTEAEAKAKIITAEAEAKVIQLQQQQLTPMYLEYLKINAWEKGGSQVPTYVGGNSPFLMMK